LALFNYVYITPDSDLKLKGNIGIGSTFDEVINVYHDTYNRQESNEHMIIAGDRSLGIIFLLDDNKVTSIYIATGSFSNLAVSPDYSGTWYSEDYELNETSEYKTPSGTKMTLDIAKDGTRGKIKLECVSYPPMSRIAVVEAELVIINGYTATFSFDDDGWGNSGTGVVTFQQDKIVVTPDVTLADNCNWNIFLDELSFYRTPGQLP
jgi:hypothetical protein